MDNEKKKDVAARLIAAMGDLDEDQVMDCARRLLNDETDRFEILRLLKEGLGKVGELYEKGEYFIADLIVSGTIYKSVLELPQMQYRAEGEKRVLGTIVMGTAEGDVHDIGKDLVKSVLTANGFRVIDLGTDVPPSAFVEAVREYRPDIVAMSGVLTIAVSGIARTIEALAAANLRDTVKIIVGGMCLSEELSRVVGADAYAPDPFDGLMVCRDLIGNKS